MRITCVARIIGQCTVKRVQDKQEQITWPAVIVSTVIIMITRDDDIDDALNHVVAMWFSLGRVKRVIICQGPGGPAPGIGPLPRPYMAPRT